MKAAVAAASKKKTFNDKRPSLPQTTPVSKNPKLKQVSNDKNVMSGIKLPFSSNRFAGLDHSEFEVN